MKKNDYMILEVLRPKPSPSMLIRIGGDKDGSYLLPDDFVGIKACFSPGVNNVKGFEDELFDVYGIPSHMCDYSSDLVNFVSPLKQGQTFKKKWLDVDGADNSISLEDWILELEPNASDDLILQMDIEGAEYRNLLKTPDSVLRRFRIVVVELHQLNVCNDPAAFRKELSPLLERLDSHFVCVHAHPNNCCGSFQIAGTELNLPNVHELTFLRRDRWESSGEITCYPPMLPHPLDITFNVRSKPPIFLNEHWLSAGKRAPESEIKMLTDQVSYLEYALKQTQALATNQADTALINLYRLAQHAAAAEPPPTSQLDSPPVLTDLAAGKSFVLSSQHSASPSLARVKTLAPFFFHTSAGVNQSITIDLGEQYDLFELRISNRSDRCEERARYLFYCLHNDQKADLHKGLPVTIEDSFLNQLRKESVTNLRGKRARYVTIFSPVNTCLHFSAINIFGA